jgi:cytochrome c oxidase cbb3-type subunit IV
MRIVINTLESIANVQWFPIVGLILLFGVFVLLIIRVIKMNKSEVDEISRLPLEDDDFQSTFSELNNEHKK